MIANPELKVIPVEKNDVNTVMSWTMYSGMKEEDIVVIYLTDSGSGET